MEKLIRTVLWFHGKEIDDLKNLGDHFNTGFFIFNFKDEDMFLFDEDFLRKNSQKIINNLSSSYLYSHKLVGKSNKVILNQIIKERLSVFVKSKVIKDHNELDSIFTNDYHKYFFLDSEFGLDYTKESNKTIVLNNLSKLTRSYWVNCKFGRIVIELYEQYNNNQLNLITGSFLSCEFDHLDYNVGENSQLILSNNHVKTLTTNSEYIRLKDIELYLFHHTNLDNNKNDFGFDNVTFEFNPSILRRFVFETQTVGFLNTYKQLLNNDSLYSERDNIKKYIYYFTSRKHWINKTLFTFNKGYYRILFPLIVTGFLILLKYSILLFNEELYFVNNNSFVPVVYPIEMYKDIIFSDSTFKYFCVKIWLFIIEPIYLYSMYSFLTGVKRFLGFKLEL